MHLLFIYSFNEYSLKYNLVSKSLLKMELKDVFILKQKVLTSRHHFAHEHFEDPNIHNMRSFRYSESFNAE